MAQVKERRLLVALMAFMLAVAGFMAFTVQSAWADDETIDVTFVLIGPDADGKDAYYIDYTKTTMPAGSTAWDLSKKMFDENKLTYSASDSQYGIYFYSMNSPFDGKTYENIEVSKTVSTYWCLLVNSSSSTVGASGYTLQDGDSIAWRYGTWDYTTDNPSLDDFTKSMYRIYNPNSGEHFYTMSEGEKDHLVSLGWQYENIGWTAPLASTVPVYRLYNANGGEHHYTTSKVERRSSAA